MIDDPRVRQAAIGAGVGAALAAASQMAQGRRIRLRGRAGKALLLGAGVGAVAGAALDVFQAGEPTMVVP